MATVGRRVILFIKKLTTSPTNNVYCNTAAQSLELSHTAQPAQVSSWLSGLEKHEARLGCQVTSPLTSPHQYCCCCLVCSEILNILVMI